MDEIGLKMLFKASLSEYDLVKEVVSREASTS